MDDDDLMMWSCGVCTFANASFDTACQMCSTPKPLELSGPASDEFVQAFKRMNDVRNRLSSEKEVNFKEMKEAMEACEQFPARKETQAFIKDTAHKAIAILLEQSSMTTAAEENVRATLQSAVRYWALAAGEPNGLEGIGSSLGDILDPNKLLYQPHKRSATFYSSSYSPAFTRLKDFYGNLGIASQTLLPALESRMAAAISSSAAAEPVDGDDSVVWKFNADAVTPQQACELLSAVGVILREVSACLRTYGDRDDKELLIGRVSDAKQQLASVQVTLKRFAQAFLSLPDDALKGVKDVGALLAGSCNHLAECFAPPDDFANKFRLQTYSTALKSVSIARRLWALEQITSYFDKLKTTTDSKDQSAKPSSGDDAEESDEAANMQSAKHFAAWLMSPDMKFLETFLGEHEEVQKRMSPLIGNLAGYGLLAPEHLDRLWSSLLTEHFSNIDVHLDLLSSIVDRAATSCISLVHHLFALIETAASVPGQFTAACLTTAKLAKLFQAKFESQLKPTLASSVFSDMHRLGSTNTAAKLSPLEESFLSLVWTLMTSTYAPSLGCSASGMDAVKAEADDDDFSTAKKPSAGEDTAVEPFEGALAQEPVEQHQAGTSTPSATITTGAGAADGRASKENVMPDPLAVGEDEDALGLVQSAMDGLSATFFFLLDKVDSSTDAVVNYLQRACELLRDIARRRSLSFLKDDLTPFAREMSMGLKGDSDETVPPPFPVLTRSTSMSGAAGPSVCSYLTRCDAETVQRLATFSPSHDCVPRLLDLIKLILRNMHKRGILIDSIPIEESGENGVDSPKVHLFGTIVEDIAEVDMHKLVSQVNETMELTSVLYMELLSYMRFTPRQLLSVANLTKRTNVFYTLCRYAGLQLEASHAKEMWSAVNQWPSVSSVEEMALLCADESSVGTLADEDLAYYNSVCDAWRGKQVLPVDELDVFREVFWDWLRRVCGGSGLDLIKVPMTFSSISTQPSLLHHYERSSVLDSAKVSEDAEDLVPPARPSHRFFQGETPLADPWNYLHRTGAGHDAERVGAATPLFVPLFSETAVLEFWSAFFDDEAKSKTSEPVAKTLSLPSSPPRYKRSTSSTDREHFTTALEQRQAYIRNICRADVATLSRNLFCKASQFPERIGPNALRCFIVLWILRNRYQVVKPLLEPGSTAAAAVLKVEKMTFPAVNDSRTSQPTVMLSVDVVPERSGSPPLVFPGTDFLMEVALRCSGGIAACARSILVASLSSLRMRACAQLCGYRLPVGSSAPSDGLLRNISEEPLVKILMDIIQQTLKGNVRYNCPDDFKIRYAQGTRLEGASTIGNCLQVLGEYLGKLVDVTLTECGHASEVRGAPTDATKCMPLTNQPHRVRCGESRSATSAGSNVSDIHKSLGGSTPPVLPPFEFVSSFKQSPSLLIRFAAPELQSAIWESLLLAERHYEVFFEILCSALCKGSSLRTQTWQLLMDLPTAPAFESALSRHSFDLTRATASPAARSKDTHTGMDAEAMSSQSQQVGDSWRALYYLQAVASKVMDNAERDAWRIGFLREGGLQAVIRQLLDAGPPSWLIEYLFSLHPMFSAMVGSPSGTVCDSAALKLNLDGTQYDARLCADITAVCLRIIMHCGKELKGLDKAEFSDGTRESFIVRLVGILWGCSTASKLFAGKRWQQGHAQQAVQLFLGQIGEVTSRSADAATATNCIVILRQLEPCFSSCIDSGIVQTQIADIVFSGDKQLSSLFWNHIVVPNGAADVSGLGDRLGDVLQLPLHVFSPNAHCSVPLKEIVLACASKFSKDGAIDAVQAVHWIVRLVNLFSRWFVSPYIAPNTSCKVRSALEQQPFLADSLDAFSALVDRMFESDTLSSLLSTEIPVNMPRLLYDTSATAEQAVITKKLLQVLLDVSVGLCLFGPAALQSSATSLTSAVYSTRYLCRSSASRNAAFALLRTTLRCLSGNGRADYPHFEEVLMQITRAALGINLSNSGDDTALVIEKAAGPLDASEWHYSPEDDVKAATGYVGLVNNGCTCYMNSLMQQLFMAPDFRGLMTDLDFPVPELLLEQDKILPQVERLEDQALLSQVDTIEAQNVASSAPETKETVVSPGPANDAEIAAEAGDPVASKVDATGGNIVLTTPGSSESKTPESQPAAVPSKSPAADANRALASLVAELSDGQKKQLANARLMFELQRTFSWLRDGSAKSFNARRLVKACTILNLQHPVTNQNDALEFYDKLMDAVEQNLQSVSGGHYLKQLKNVLEGATAQRVVRLCCGKADAAPAIPFRSLSVNIRNCEGSLLKALRGHFKAELMTGSNAVHCATCDKKAATRIQTSISKLPEVLVIHLQRFEVDYTNGEVSKVNDRVSFPSELNMYPFTAEGLSLRDRLKRCGLTSSPSAFMSDDSHMYDLVGVLVHLGTALSGHYYSFIKERKTAQLSDNWFRFDDKTVTPFDPSQLPAEAFGGVQKITKRNTSYPFNEYIAEEPIVKNALLLFYERRHAGAGLTSSTAETQQQEQKLGQVIEQLPSVSSRTALNQSLSTLRTSNDSVARNMHGFDPCFRVFLAGIASDRLQAMVHAINPSVHPSQSVEWNEALEAVGRHSELAMRTHLRSLIAEYNREHAAANSVTDDIAIVASVTNLLESPFGTVRHHPDSLFLLITALMFNILLRMKHQGAETERLAAYLHELMIAHPPSARWLLLFASNRSAPLSVTSSWLCRGLLHCTNTASRDAVASLLTKAVQVVRAHDICTLEPASNSALLHVFVNPVEFDTSFNLHLDGAKKKEQEYRAKYDPINFQQRESAKQVATAEERCEKLEATLATLKHQLAEKDARVSKLQLRLEAENQAKERHQPLPDWEFPSEDHDEVDLTRGQPDVSQMYFMQQNRLLARNTAERLRTAEANLAFLHRQLDSTQEQLRIELERKEELKSRHAALQSAVEESLARLQAARAYKSVIYGLCRQTPGPASEVTLLIQTACELLSPSVSSELAFDKYPASWKHFFGFLQGLAESTADGSPARHSLGPDLPQKLIHYLTGRAVTADTGDTGIGVICKPTTVEVYLNAYCEPEKVGTGPLCAAVGLPSAIARAFSRGVDDDVPRYGQVGKDWNILWQALYRHASVGGGLHTTPGLLLELAAPEVFDRFAASRSYLYLRSGSHIEYHNGGKHLFKAIYKASVQCFIRDVFRGSLFILLEPVTADDAVRDQGCDYFAVRSIAASEADTISVAGSYILLPNAEARRRAEECGLLSQALPFSADMPSAALACHPLHSWLALSCAAKNDTHGLFADCMSYVPGLLPPLYGAGALVSNFTAVPYVKAEWTTDEVGARVLAAVSSLDPKILGHDLSLPPMLQLGGVLAAVNGNLRRQLDNIAGLAYQTLSAYMAQPKLETNALAAFIALAFADEATEASSSANDSRLACALFLDGVRKLLPLAAPAQDKPDSHFARVWADPDKILLERPYLSTALPAWRSSHLLDTAQQVIQTWIALYCKSRMSMTIKSVASHIIISDGGQLRTSWRTALIKAGFSTKAEPLAEDGPVAYKVAGAGTAMVNGIYYLAPREAHGAPCFIRRVGSMTFALMRFRMTDGTFQWYITAPGMWTHYATWNAGRQHDHDLYRCKTVNLAVPDLDPSKWVLVPPAVLGRGCNMCMFPVDRRKALVGLAPVPTITQVSGPIASIEHSAASHAPTASVPSVVTAAPPSLPTNRALPAAIDDFDVSDDDDDDDGVDSLQGDNGLPEDDNDGISPTTGLLRQNQVELSNINIHTPVRPGPRITSTLSPLDADKEGRIRIVMDMGFTKEQAEKALRRCAWDIALAADMLLMEE